MDEFLCRVRSENLLDHVMEIAGRPRGVHRYQNNLFLVKKGATIIPSKPGGTGFIDRIIRKLLPDDKQYRSFMAWLHSARRALLDRRRRQLPVLVIAGGAGDGKSLLIEIVRLSLGGRSANAHSYLNGKTRFNADLAGAELLYLDDSTAAKDYATKSFFA